MYIAKDAYINEGCISGNKYRIVKTDSIGKVVVIYDGYYDFKKHEFKLYPKRLNYPRHGIDKITAHTIRGENIVSLSKATATT